MKLLKSARCNLVRASEIPQNRGEDAWVYRHELKTGENG
jgi:hypothetical protein